MIHTGSIEPIQLDGAVHPKIDQFIRSSEYTASTVKICWNSDQNTALAMNSGMNARTRRALDRVDLRAGQHHHEVRRPTPTTMTPVVT